MTDAERDRARSALLGLAVGDAVVTMVEFSNLGTSSRSRTGLAASTPCQELSSGVERHRIEGGMVPMTSPAKTVAACFRYRDTIGTDVAVEALRDCLRKRKASPAEIFEMAKVDRVARVMRPAIEALV